VPTDTAATDSAGQKPAGDPAARLQEIRARVAELQRRIKTERDPKAVAELRAEAAKLTELLSAVVRAGGAAKVDKAEQVVWPRDLSGGPDGDSEWGADPAEVAGG
jgi:hypothetical protein